jgi:hypothetical protein
MRKFKRVDDYRWVKVLSERHFEIVNGLQLPDGSILFSLHDIDFNHQDLDYKKIDEVITFNYSSCSKFFLKETIQNNPEWQWQLIAEMLVDSGEDSGLRAFMFDSSRVPEEPDSLKLPYVLDRLGYESVKQN